MNDQRGRATGRGRTRASAPRAVLARAILFLLVPSFAFSQTVRAGPVEAALIAETASIEPGKPFLAAVRFRMDPEWHIYWKNPGDTGLPTTVAWDLPPGFTAGPLQWPVPQRFVAQGAASYGYDGTVSVLAEITPPAALPAVSPVTLRAHVGWLACSIACTPGTADLSLRLPVHGLAARPDPPWAATLRVDWTDRNDTIARALAGFSRAGVPLYVLYRAGSSDPVVLPEILTPGLVLDALAHAGR